jgi:hypothetical protein
MIDNGTAFFTDTNIQSWPYGGALVQIVSMAAAVAPDFFDEPANLWCAVASSGTRFPAEPELRRVLVAPDQLVDDADEHDRGMPWWRTLRGARRQRYRRASA